MNVDPSHNLTPSQSSAVPGSQPDSQPGSQPGSQSDSQPDLPRVLGARHAMAIVVGTIIGSGIFLVPSEMMREVGSSGLVYLAWVLGGILSFLGALTYAELGAVPEEGTERIPCCS